MGIVSIYLDEDEQQKFDIVKKVMQNFNPNISNTDVWKQLVDLGLTKPKNEDVVEKFTPSKKTKHSIRLDDEAERLMQKTGLNKSDSLKYCLELF